MRVQRNRVFEIMFDDKLISNVGNLKDKTICLEKRLRLEYSCPQVGEICGSELSHHYTVLYYP